MGYMVGNMSANNRISYMQTSKKPKRSGLLKYIGLAIVALALISLVFSSLFSGANANNRDSIIFGYYGNKDIAYQPNNSFGYALQQEMDRFGQGTNQNTEIYRFFQRAGWRAAFERTALEKAIEYHVGESGYEPSKRAVDRQIVDIQDLRTDGEFDREKYNAISNPRKIQLRESIEQNLLHSAWSNDVLEGKYRSDAALDFIEDMKSTVRSYDYVSIPFSDYPDEDVISYGNENSDLFRTIALSRITVENEETANDILSQYNELKQDITAFSDLAKENSVDSYRDEGGSMGETEFFELAEILSEEDVKSIFTLGNGEVAGPFEVGDEWMIVRTDGEIKKPLIDEKIDLIRNYMLDNDLGKIEDSILSRAEELRKNAESAESFSTTMNSQGLEVLTTNAFSLNYGGESLLGASPEDSEGTAISEVSKSEEFWNAISVLDQVGEISRPIVHSRSVSIFSLKSMEELEEESDNWDNIVKYEISRFLENDYRSIVISDNSKLFVDQFDEVYEQIFSDQG